MSNDKIDKTPNERYFDSYVSILKESLNAQVHSNISLQANNKLAGEMLQELQQVNASLNEQIAKLAGASTPDASALNGKIQELQAAQDTITALQNDKNALQAKIDEYRNEFDSMKGQVEHLDTFKNQIVQLQQSVASKDSIINDLTTQVSTLKAPPTIVATTAGAPAPNKDGGVF
jgi:chromosome segregation ATPase